MHSSTTSALSTLSSYRLDQHMIRYSLFIPKLYNYCKSLGFKPGKIMPSCAFCSDENQGYPTILIAKHFKTFPFSHGMVGGVVATDLHTPHASHGDDLVIIQASHVGYNPETRAFGEYRRTQTSNHLISQACGKISGLLNWYQEQYRFARENTYVSRDTQGNWSIIIDNQLLSRNREEGIFLSLERMIEGGQHGEFSPLQSYSTSQRFRASEEISALFSDLPDQELSPLPLEEKLLPEMFYFRRPLAGEEEGRSHLEKNLQPVMPWILTSEFPMLAAAKINTQIEFDRTYRSILLDEAYRNRQVLFIAGLNIDISPSDDQPFPRTNFAPWAAFVQKPDGSHFILEQDELVDLLNTQSEINPDEMALDSEISRIMELPEIHFPAE